MREEFPVVGRIVECSKCKRKILVERILIGVNHTYTTVVTCWECLDLERQKWAAERYKLKVSG